MDQKKDTGDLITCGHNTTISFWNQNNPQPSGEIEFPFKLNCISVSPSDRYFAVGGETGDVNSY